MIEFLFVFLFCLLALVIVFLVMQYIIGAHARNSRESEFIDENGDHEYYERAIIEKKQFHKLHPEIPEDDVRSIRRLIPFSKKKKWQ